MACRRRGGFTLIEIMIVIAIIAVLAAIAVPNYRKFRERSQRRACYANLKTIAGALEWYCADTNQPYEIASETDLEPLRAGGYLQTIPECPQKGPGQYSCLGGSKQAVCAFHGTINPVVAEEEPDPSE